MLVIDHMNTLYFADFISAGKFCNML